MLTHRDSWRNVRSCDAEQAIELFFPHQCLQEKRCYEALCRWIVALARRVIECGSVP
jgi:hypothetical protein